MAKGKGKKVASSGPHKKHGPKKKMFHQWSSTMRLHLSKCGLLSKYHNKESWEQSLTSKGVRTLDNELWKEFSHLSIDERKEWFKNHKKK